MIEHGGLPHFSYKYKSNINDNKSKQKVKKSKIKSDIPSSKKSRFISTDMTKVNIADVLSFIKQEDKPDNLLAEFQNLDIVSEL
jgi:lipoate-protein ligase A